MVKGAAQTVLALSNRLLGSLALGNVDVDADDALGARCIANTAALGREPHEGAVTPDYAEFAVVVVAFLDR